MVKLTRSGRQLLQQDAMAHIIQTASFKPNNELTVTTRKTVTLLGLSTDEPALPRWAVAVA
jgi:hypothetical protein